MVQALLEKRKSQTRRLNGLDKLNEHPDEWTFHGWEYNFNERLCAVFAKVSNPIEKYVIPSPYGQTGDVLWVRENYLKRPNNITHKMLKVKDIRVERLQEISDEDAIAEGIIEVSSFVFAYEKQNPKGHYSHASLAYKHLWQSLNGSDSWKANPWVWVIEFEPCAMPEDFLTR